MKYISKATNGRNRLSSGRKASLLAVLCGALGFAGIAGAHHSFAMFDQAKTVTIEGTVVEFQWTNPHAWIEMMVATPTGPVQYSIEGHNTRTLGGAGWKFNTLKPGDKISLDMHPLRNGAPGGSLASVTFPDGHTLSGI